MTHEIYVDNLTAKVWGHPAAQPFTLNRATAELTVGDSTTFSPLYDDVRNKAAAFTWSTDDGAVAKVDQYGVVTAVGPGTAEITASSAAGGSAGATVTVGAAPTWFLWVSPDGDDASGDGTQAKPFATVAAARDHIRELAGLPAGGIQVNIKRGWYYQEETLVFTPEDSGEAGSPIVYTTAPGEATEGEPSQAVIHSGEAVTGWRELTDEDEPLGLPQASREHILVADIEPGHVPHDLYVEYTEGEPAERQQVARQVASESYLNWPAFVSPDTRANPIRQREENDGATKGWELAFQPGHLVDVPSNGDAEVIYLPEVYWNSIAVLRDIKLAGSTWWTGGQQTARLEDLNTTVFAATQLANHGTVFSTIRGGAGRYNILNAPKYLDAAGEWAVDSAEGKIYWWPKNDLTAGDVNGMPASGADPATPGIGVMVPHAFELVRLQGDDSKPWTDKVEYLEFRDLSFMYNDRLSGDLWAEDKANPRSLAVRNAENPDAAIYAEGVAHLVFAGNAIGHTGTYGLALNHYAQDVLMLGNEVFDTGSGGFQIYGYGPNATMQVNRGNVILGNHVSNVGNAYMHSAAVTVYGAGTLDTKFNHFENLPYGAVSVVGAGASDFEPGAESAAALGTVDAYGNLGTQYGIQWDDLYQNADEDWKVYSDATARAKALQRYQGSDRNVVEYNVTDDSMMTMEDGGAYYAWSPGANVEFNYNVARKAAGNGINPLYADDYACGMHWRGNIAWSQGSANRKCGNDQVWIDNVVSQSQPAGYAALRGAIEAEQVALGGEPVGLVTDHIPNGVTSGGPAGVVLDAVVSLRCVAGSVTLVALATNEDGSPAWVEVESYFGSKAFRSVAPGSNAMLTANTRAASVGAGTVTVRGRLAGDPSTATVYEFTYPAKQCGV
jgi:hypothetical protein